MYYNPSKGWRQVRIIGRILSKFLIGASNPKLCKINVITDVGWKYGCIYTGELFKILKLVWIEGVACINGLHLMMNGKWLRVTLLKNLCYKTRIHITQLARYFCPMSNPRKPISIKRYRSNTWNLWISISQHTVWIHLNNCMEGLCYRFQGRCSDIGSAFKNLIANWSVSPRQDPLDEEVLCIYNKVSRWRHRIFAWAYNLCIDRDFHFACGYLYSIDVLSSTDTGSKCLGRSWWTLHKGKRTQIIFFGYFLSGCTKIPPPKRHCVL